MSSDYKYRAVELTPTVFADLMLLLFSSSSFTRDQCISSVMMYHTSNGGKCGKREYISVFKKATIILRKDGYALDNPAYGVWIISKHYDGFDSYFKKKQGAVEDNCDFSESDTCLELGDGEETIYLYYYPCYRKFANMKGHTVWPCKVGMTTKNVWDRIYSQAATCFPEEPFIALIIHCDDAHKLEQTIHNVLKMNGKWIEDAPGKEWFMISPEEVKSILSMCNVLKDN